MPRQFAQTLLGDIGATNARLALLANGVLGQVTNMEVAHYPGFLDVVAEFIKLHGDRVPVSDALIAVAGPVQRRASGSAELRPEDALDEAAEQPGQSHWRFQHEENDALARAVGDRPVIDGAVRDRDIARRVVTIGIAETAVQHQHRFQPLVRVRRNGLSGTAGSSHRRARPG